MNKPWSDDEQFMDFIWLIQDYSSKHAARMLGHAGVNIEDKTNTQLNIEAEEAANAVNESLEEIYEIYVAGLAARKAKQSDAVIKSICWQEAGDRYD